MYDIIVVGAGFAGAVIAERLSNEYGKRILLVEQRSQIGGNMFDFVDKYGFLVQKYGPHIIYTNSINVLEYLSKFCTLIPHDCVMLSNLDNKYIQLPFNFKSVQQMYNPEKAKVIIDSIRESFDCTKRISIFDLMNSKNKTVSEFGSNLYSKAFETYICKQWGLRPNQIAQSVINRCSFSPSYSYRYLDRDFQYLPNKGFTNLIAKMISNKNIVVHTNDNALNHLKIVNDLTYWDGKLFKGPIIYTGSIDSLFDYKYGVLPYRSLRFNTKYYNCDKKLPCEIISMPQHPTIIRKTEYKYFCPSAKDDVKNKTVVVSESPYQYKAGNKSIQCYPIINDENDSVYTKYLEEAKRIKNLHLVGRLAEYKYYNMDAVILNALNKANEFSKD